MLCKLLTNKLLHMLFYKLIMSSCRYLLYLIAKSYIDKQSKYSCAEVKQYAPCQIFSHNDKIFDAKQF